jgi:hypothetical protein
VIGYIKDATGSYQGGLYFLAALSIAGAVLTVIGVNETAAPNWRRGLFPRESGSRGHDFSIISKRSGNTLRLEARRHRRDRG